LELKNISFLSFPDTALNGEKDSLYVFRLRRSAGSYLYGYVLFRQQKNASVRRGYLQQSVCVLSPHPFVGLFLRIAELAGSFYFEFGTRILEVAAHSICSWPALEDLKRSSFLEFPFVGEIIRYALPALKMQARFAVPNVYLFAQGGADIRETEGTLVRKGSGKVKGKGKEKRKGTRTAQVHRLPRQAPGTPPLTARDGDSTLRLPPRCCPFDEIASGFHLAGVITNIFHLWELVLCARPILCYGTSPEAASSAVLALVSLVNPISYAGDFRPFITVQDSDFAELTSAGEAPRILGVTNPLFLKGPVEWETVVQVGSAPDTVIRGSSFLRGWKESFVSKRKPTIPCDKAFIRALQLPEASRRKAFEVQRICSMLRSYMKSLTEAFVAPLQEYCDEYVAEVSTKISPVCAPPPVQYFEENNFLRFLASYNWNSPGNHALLKKMSRKDLASLYRSFIRSRNFAEWHSVRWEEAMKIFNEIYRSTLYNADILGVLHGKEISIRIDLQLRIESELSREESKPNGGNNAMIARLKEQLSLIHSLTVNTK
jgi:hypothetical protein